MSSLLSIYPSMHPFLHLSVHFYFTIYNHVGIRPDCPRLGSPANGRVEISTENSQLVAIYECDVLYFLTQGSRVRVCLSNGEWSGSMPQCSCKFECI